MAAPPAYFLGTTFFLHGMGEHEQAAARAHIAAGRGKVTAVLSPAKVNYVVSTREAVRRAGPDRARLAEWVDHGKPLVSVDFLETCRQFARPVDPYTFSLLGEYVKSEPPVTDEEVADAAQEGDENDDENDDDDDDHNDDENHNDDEEGEERVNGDNTFNDDLIAVNTSNGRHPHAHVHGDAGEAGSGSSSGAEDIDHSALPFGTSPPAFSVPGRRPSRNNSRTPTSSSRASPTSVSFSGALIGRRTGTDETLTHSLERSQLLSPPPPMSRSRSSDGSMRSPTRAAGTASTPPTARKQHQKKKTLARGRDRAVRLPNVSEDELAHFVDGHDVNLPTRITLAPTSINRTVTPFNTPTLAPVQSQAIVESPVHQLERFHTALQALELSLQRGASKQRLRLSASEGSEQRRLDNDALWAELRATLNERSLSEEQDAIHAERQRADGIMGSILAFKVQQGAPIAKVAELIAEVLKLADDLDECFPTHRRFRESKAQLYDAVFSKLNTLRTWHTIYNMVTDQLASVAKWIATSAPDVFSTASIAEFLMRELRNVSILVVFQQRRFKSLGLILELGHACLTDPHVITAFVQHNLPPLDDTLMQLSTVGASIISEYLRIKNDKRQHLTKVSLTDATEMVRDIHESLYVSTRAHQKYGVDLIRTLNLRQPVTTDPLGDEIVRTMDVYFKLLHLKWQSGSTTSSFSIGDFLEEEWSFVSAISPRIRGGEVAAAVGFCKLCESMFNRMTKDLEESGKKLEYKQLEAQPRDTMKAIIKLLETFRWRSRRILRFLKKLGSQLENSIDFHTEDAAALWQKMSATRHSLVVRQLDREPVLTEKGLRIFVADDLHGEPDKVLSVFRVVMSYSTEELEDGNHHEGEDYYVVLAPNQQRWQWNGRITEVSEAVAAELNGSPSPLLGLDSIRLIAPTSHGLVKAKKRFLRIMDSLVPPSDETYAHAPSVNSHLLAVKKAAVALATVLIDQANELHSRPLPQTPLERTPSIDLRLGTPSSSSSGPIPTTVSTYFAISTRPSLRSMSSMASTPLPTTLPTTGSLPATRTPSSTSLPISASPTPTSMSSTSLSVTSTPGPDSLSYPIVFGEIATLVQRFSDFAGTFSLDVMRFVRGPTRKTLQRKLFVFLQKWVVFVMETLMATDKNAYNFACQSQRWATRVLHFTELDLVKEAILQQDPAEFNKLFDVLIKVFEKMSMEGCAECIIDELTFSTKAYDSFTDRNPEPAAQVSASERRRLKLVDLDQKVQLAQVEGKVVGKVLSRDDVPQHVHTLAASFGKSRIRWERKASLGSGTYGQVYKAINLDTGELMAVKLIRLSASSTDEEVLQSVGEEMRLLETLKHDHIIRYMGMEVQRKEVALFMEYCSEGSLASVLRRDGPIDKESIVQAYTHQIVEGLVYLHNARVVHCDVKPDNILIDSMGRLKLADFGSAVMKSMTNLENTSRPRKPHEDLRGTPNYMCPEVILGQKSTEAADIWALGCCVWEMVVGKAPWHGMDPVQIMFKVGQRVTPPLPPPSPMRYSDGLRLFMESCFAIDPVQRATALALQSHEFLHSTEGHASLHHPHPHPHHHHHVPPGSGSR